MIEIGKEFKPYFFLASILLGTQIVYLLNAMDVPRHGFFYTLSLLCVAGSVPTLACACLAAMVGYTKQTENLLLAGGALSIAWFAFAVASITLLGLIVFLIFASVSFAMLHYHHKDARKSETQAD